jgi:hypothetical protein
MGPGRMAPQAYEFWGICSLLTRSCGQTLRAMQYIEMGLDYFKLWRDDGHLDRRKQRILEGPTLCQTLVI